MNIRFKLLLLLILITAITTCFGQDYQIRTLFNGPRNQGTGGYAALSNKFTMIRGEYANMAEVYGGVYINHRFLLGVSVAAVTNNLQVPYEFRTDLEENLSYEYGQFGLMTEYTLWSHRAIHLSFFVMNGAGFTVQYIREPQDYDHWDPADDHPTDANWFFVSEPGVRVEMNIFKWFRFSPGVSYRYSDGSDGLGMSDKDVRGLTLNATLKFGKF